MHVCQTYLAAQIKDLAPYDDTNVFFEQLKRDFLKSQPYAALYDIARDEKKPVSRKVFRSVNADRTVCTYTIQRYQKRLTFRCFFWAPDKEELEDILKSFEQNISERKKIPDSQGIEIKVILDDVVRKPEERDRRLRRPELAIVRIVFEGGIFVERSNPIIQDVTIYPDKGGLNGKEG